MAPIDHKRQTVFERAYARHKEDGHWPTVLDLQREISNEQPDLHVRQVVADARGYAAINAPDDQVQLTLRGLALVPAARPVLEGYLLAVRAMIARFLDQSTAARYSQTDLASLNLEPGVEAELDWLLEEDRWPFGSGSGRGADGQPWEYDIDDRVMTAADVVTVDEFVAVRYGEPLESPSAALEPDPITGATGGRPTVNPDKPIARAEEDELDRLPLARALALQALAQPRDEGFVMGVSGPWGSGKTSLLNLMVGTIEENGPEGRPRGHVVRFDPWMFSSSEELVLRFLREMSSQMIIEPRLKAVASQIAGYAEVLAPLAVLAPAPWLAPIVAASTRASRRLVRRKGIPSAQQQRENVRDALLALDRRLVVVIDDLDRLQEQELRDIVRLVKLVGDFPNTTYVLAYDQQRVATALGVTEQDGHEFLEKIIQLSHDVPPTPEGALGRVLVKAISTAVGDLDAYRFNPNIYGELYAAGLRELFTTVRDVRRYGNALPVTLELVKDEIELADILTLEALRIRTPKSFALITASKDALTDTRSARSTSRGQAPAGAQQQISDILAAGGAFGPQVQGILRRLFPVTDQYFSGVTYGPDWLSEWRRDRRVAHPDVFDIYINRAVPESELPTPLVERVLADFENQQALTSLLEGLDHDQVETLLDRLEDFEDRFPTNHPDVPVSVIYNQRSQLRTQPRHVFDLAAGHRVARIALRILRRLDQQDAEHATNLALVKIPFLSDRADLVRLVGHRPGSGSGLVSEQAAQLMEASIVTETLAATPADLANEHDLLTLMVRTQQARPDDFSTRIADLTKDDQFLLRLLRAATTDLVSQSLSGGAVSTTPQLNWPALTQIIGEDRFINRLRGLLSRVDPANLDDRTKAAIELAREHLPGPSEPA